MESDRMRKRSGLVHRVALVGAAATAITILFSVIEPSAQRRGPDTGAAGAGDVRTAVGRSQSAADVTGLSPARAEAFVEAGHRRLNYVPGEVIVKFRPGVTVSGQQRALSALRSRPAASGLRWRGGIARLVDSSQPDSHVLASQLETQPEVEYAHPNYIRRTPGMASDRVMPERIGADPGLRAGSMPAGVPNDPDYAGLQWNLSLIDMPGAWDINPGGIPSVIVAVVDTGVTTSATTTSRALWTGQGFEQVPLRFDVSPDLSASRMVSPRDLAFEPGALVLDLDGHGTHVASTIAEDGNNARSLAGIAYQTRLMPVKVCVGFWELMIERAAVGIGGYIPVDSGGCAS